MFSLFKSSARAPLFSIASHAAPESKNGKVPFWSDAAEVPETAVDRLMARVDYYLHCELDVQYDHERPELVRDQLREEIEHELAMARESGLVSPHWAAQAAANNAMQPPGARA